MIERPVSAPEGPAMRYISRNELFGYGFLTGAVVVLSLPLFPYQWHVFMHIAGAVVFLGNIIVTGVWMLLAERTRSIPVIHFSAKAVIRANFLFTLPGVLLLVINGVVMVVARWGGWDAFHQISWVTIALELFIASGVIWVGALLPAQHRMAVFSAPSAYPEALPAQFFSAIRRWYFWGVLAILLPVASLYLMVHKPAFG